MAYLKTLNLETLQMTEETPDLDITRKEKRLKVKQGDVTTTFVIKEMMGDGRDRYAQSNRDRSKNTFKVTGPDGKEVEAFQNIVGMKSNLLCECLFELTDAGLKPLTFDECQALPFRAIDKLFEMAFELNDLGDEGEKAAKND